MYSTETAPFFSLTANVGVVSMPFDSSETNRRVTCSGQEVSAACRWDSEGVPGVLESGNSSRG